METPSTYADLFFGYTVIWVVLALYIFSLVRRLNALTRSLEKKDKQ